MQVPKLQSSPPSVVASQPDSPSFIAEEMFCPVGQEVMFDPVIDKYGHTYERHIIVMAIGSNGRSPLTNEPLLSSDPLVPNRCLRNLIERHPAAAQEAAAARRDYEAAQSSRTQPAVAAAAARPRATRPSTPPTPARSYVEIDVVEGPAASEAPSLLDPSLRRSQRNQLRHQFSPQPLPPCTAPQQVRVHRRAFGPGTQSNSGPQASLEGIFGQLSVRPSAPPLPGTAPQPSAPRLPGAAMLPSAPPVPRSVRQLTSAGDSQPNFQQQRLHPSAQHSGATAWYSSAELHLFSTAQHRLGPSAQHPSRSAEYTPAEIQRLTRAPIRPSPAPRLPQSGAQSVFKGVYRTSLASSQNILINPEDWVPYAPAPRSRGALARVLSSPAERVDRALLQWLPLVSGPAPSAAAAACRDHENLRAYGQTNMRPEIKKLAFRKALNKWYKAYSPILQRNLPYTAFMNTLQVYVDQQPILDLSNLNLKSLPPCIGEMNWLKEIYLHGNQLAEVPAFLGQLPRLDKVTLYGNRFLAPNDPYASLPLA